jgi:hypothetical protein
MSADAVEAETINITHPNWCDPEECWLDSLRPWHRSRMQFLQLKDALGTRIGIRLLRCTTMPNVTFVEFEAYADDIEEPVMEFMLMADDLAKLSELLGSVSLALVVDEAPPMLLAITGQP